MIGLKREMVRLLPHQREWNDAAVAMIKQLRLLLGNAAADIQHVGSTVIESIHAKTIIDIVIGVNDFDDILNYTEVLREHHIIYRGAIIPNELLYAIGNGEITTHYIHAVIMNETNWNNYINFRDHLNAHPQKAMQYVLCKQELAQMYPHDRKSYTAGKEAVIQQLLTEAHMWKLNLTQ